MPPALMERIERRLRRCGADQLGHDRAVAVGNRGAAERSVTLGRGCPAGRRWASTCCSPTPKAGRCREQRGVEGHLRVRGAAVIERYFGEEQQRHRRGRLVRHRRSRAHRRGRQSHHHRPRQGSDQVGRRMDQSRRDRGGGRRDCPQVSLAAVIGRADPKWGERPILLVEMREQRDDQRRGTARAAARHRSRPGGFPTR